jgi:hypothetical protein
VKSRSAPSTCPLAGRRILVLDREASPGRAIIDQLQMLGCDVITARPGELSRE